MTDKTQKVHVTLQRRKKEGKRISGGGRGRKELTVHYRSLEVIRRSNTGFFAASALPGLLGFVYYVQSQILNFFNWRSLETSEILGASLGAFLGSIH